MRKLIKNSIIIALFTIIVLTVFPTTVFATEYQPRFEAPNGEPYYTSELNVYSQTGYGMPNCVAYAYGRIYELNGEKPLIDRGNAGEWWYINKYNDYYEYGDEPRLGAIACWSNHVAVVEEISDDGAITISESHWGGTYFDTATYYNMYSHYGQTFYGYIYAYNEPEEEEVPEEEVLNQVYKTEEESIELEEINCFNALGFSANTSATMNPKVNTLLNSK
jgi:surface antigen